MLQDRLGLGVAEIGRDVGERLEGLRVGPAQAIGRAEAVDEGGLAAHIAGLPPLAAGLTKESLNRGLDIPNLDDAAWVDAYRFMALGMTADAKAQHAKWRDKP